MPRFFASIGACVLERKVWAAFSRDDRALEPRLLRKKLGKDLKVAFDFENWQTHRESQEDSNLLGLTTFSNGLTFWGMSAGGDWQHPVFFVLYWDGKKLRGYVPTQGNPWNTKTRTAYGNSGNEVADLKNAKKRWPKYFRQVTEFEPDMVDFDFQLIEADLRAHLLPARERS